MELRYNNGMWLFVAIMHGVLYLLYVCTVSVRMPKGNLSDFELHRRARLRDDFAKKSLVRAKGVAIYRHIKPLLVSTLLVIWTGMGIAVYGYRAGLSIAVIGGILAGFIYRRQFTIRVANYLYVLGEPYIIKLERRLPRILAFIRGQREVSPQVVIGSREELVHILERSSSAIDDIDRSALLGVLGFSNKTVSTVMVPKKRVAMIKKSEILGPLVLDELHRTGHTCFPVTSREGGRVVGFLDIEGLMQIHADARSSRVETRMDARVHMIASEDTLDRALIECIEGRQTMLIVVNSSDEMVGILTLGDIIGELLGSKSEVPV